MAVEEDVGIVVEDGEIQCRNHPYKNNKMNPGGICAFCLEEKLGKLVSSSFPISVFPSSEEFIPIPIPMNTIQTITTTHNNDYSSSSRHPCRIPFPITQQKQKQQQQNKNKNTTSVSVSATAAAGFDFKRSKSVNYDADGGTKKGFWSFLYHSKHRNHYKRKSDNKPCYEITHQISPQQQQHGSKVSRSRSLGCGGSRSFSGDFFERISTGFGDCTLRRIESQRVVGKEVGIGHDCIKERVKCGGIFSGFNENGNGNGKNRSWGLWTLPSPIAYLSLSTSSSSAKRGGAESNKINLNNVTPSLMAVTG